MAVISRGEVVRAVRLLNVPLGLAAAAIPWFTGGADWAYAAACTGLGLAIAALAVPRGVKTESYGSWDRYVR